MLNAPVPPRFVALVVKATVPPSRESSARAPENWFCCSPPDPVGRLQAFAFDFQQGHVGTRVSTHQFGFHFAAIGQAHDDFIRVCNHVIVGQDVTIGRDDKTRAQRLGFTLTTTLATRCWWQAAFKVVAQARRQAFQIGHLAHT